MYSAGTIKLVWIPKENYTIMESKMFDSIEDATSYANSVGRKDYMLMSLIETKDHYYKWKVLPYGKYNSYKYGMKISESPIIKFGSAFLIVFGAYSLFKSIKKSIK
jgi:hypothetical protein